jgi:hypothetical protein
MREIKRSRGYITIAQSSGEIDYLRMAYGLALSLKATQSEVSKLTVLVTPGTEVPKKYAAVFDKVIEIPWGDDAESATWKIQNKWKVIHATPYDETVLLDCDMIFPTDVSSWWDTLAFEKDVWVTTQPVTYRGEPIVPGVYREQFATNDLPMVYTAFMYFRKCQAAFDYFDTVRAVYHAWKHLRLNYKLRKNDDEMLLDMASARSPFRHSWTHFFRDFPRNVSGDLAFSIAMKITGTEDLFTQDGIFPTFTHMKSLDQGLSTTHDTWSKMFPATLQEDLSLFVGNYRQCYPFHYVEKGWLTEDVIAKLEKAAHG